MRQKSNSTPASSETLVRNIRRATRKHHAAEEKIRTVLDGLRGEMSPDDSPCHGSILLDTRNAAKIIAAAIGTNTEQSRASRGGERHVVDRRDARLKTKVPSLVPVFPLYSQAGNSEVQVPVAIH